jgi:hypothetical protein
VGALRAIRRYVSKIVIPADGGALTVVGNVAAIFSAGNGTSESGVNVGCGGSQPALSATLARLIA